MSDDFDKLREIFLAALERAPEQRDAYLDQICAGDEELRRNVDVMLRARSRRRGAARPSRGARRANWGPRTSVRNPRHGHRPVQAARANRRRRHGHRLDGPADRAGQAAGRRQAHQGRDGLPASHRPLRGRAPGPGPDGPRQHRPRARRPARPTPAGPTSSWTSSRGCRSPGTATSTTSRPGSGWNCSSRSARRSSTRIRRASSTAT